MKSSVSACRRGKAEAHLLAFGRRYEQIAAPFRWKFTRADVHQLLTKTGTATAAAAA